MTEAIIVAVLGLVGTLAGSYFANRKSTAPVAAAHPRCLAE